MCQLRKYLIALLFFTCSTEAGEFGRLVAHVDALIENGMYRSAASAISNTDLELTSEQTAELSILGGIAQLETGQFAEAINSFSTALAGLSDSEFLTKANVLNNLALAYEGSEDIVSAKARFEASVESAKRASLDDARLISAQANANLSRLTLRDGNLDVLATRFHEDQSRLQQLPLSTDKVRLALSLGDIARQAFWQLLGDQQWRKSAFALFSDAEEMAQQLKDPLLRAYSLGNLSRLYEEEKRHAEALTLAQQAVFYAQAAEANESLYQWEWLSARQYRALGDLDEAFALYQRSIATLETVRADLIDGSPYTFRRKIEPLFMELADVSLQRTSSMSEGEERQSRLLQVRNILERSKSAEIQDYFQNDCVLPNASINADSVATGTASVYPVLLDDRVELLVGIGEAVYQFSSAVSEKELNLVVYELRELLESYSSADSYKRPAGLLHRWLVAPILDLLDAQEIDTIVFVPGGSLRTIPLSVLYDGKQHLVERYAIATTPGMQLTAPNALDIDGSAVFAGGISEAVQGLSALPSVSDELNMLEQTYTAKKLQNADFTEASLLKEVSDAPYSVVHIATHGHFDQDPDKSFLLTYDNRMSLNRLESAIGSRDVFTDDPLELLVLSACETAAGDDRAALGLAGIALKAGARSAIASLWQVSDAASVELMNTFYRALAQPGISKAKALRQAQRALIDNKRFEHPSVWAPYLMIGNWL